MHVTPNLFPIKIPSLQSVVLVDNFIILIKCYIKRNIAQCRCTLLQTSELDVSVLCM
jgi:hypothetical protein